MNIRIQADPTEIIINDSIYEPLEVMLASHYTNAKKIIITDETVFGLWIEQLVTAVPALHQAEIIQIPAGEDSKCLEIAHHIWGSLSDYEIGRKDLILNFGGGVITDLGGFIASTFKRGLDFINIPTTLLSQVDASVGGKTGIDLGPFKNQIGTFAYPKAVFIGTDFLSTLPETQLYSGYAEMLKHGLIADQTHWQALKSISPNDVANHPQLIQHSIEIKYRIVKADPTETGIRKALNFGHTIGHAIEGHLMSLESPVPHGFAVAWGMIAEAYLAFQTQVLPKQDWDEIYYVLSDLYPSAPITTAHIDSLLQLMQQDKKNEDGQINFTLLSTIGAHVINRQSETEQIAQSLKFLINTD